MQVAILHDTIEDTDATYDDLSDKFGSRVADGVLALTKDSTLPSKSAKMADSLQRIEAQPIEIAIVKLCDRITKSHLATGQRKRSVVTLQRLDLSQLPYQGITTISMLG
jgi:(p)ppGpp synthase/HD superfamily hydrolase